MDKPIPKPVYNQPCFVCPPKYKTTLKGCEAIAGTTL